MRKVLSVLLLCLVFAAPAQAQEVFSLYVPSDDDDVKRMLSLVAPGEGDVVIDLGSGDGRIVIQAARMNAGVRGVGVEIDPKLVHESIAKAQAAGVGDRVQFLHQNVFDADFSKATVITMWLFPELMRLLRPKILAEARPGTRVVTRTWDLSTWPPDATDESGAPVYKWIVPARVAGNWEWELEIAGRTHVYAAVVEQWFQSAEGVVRVGSRRGLFEGVALSGEAITFALTMTVDGVGPVHHRFEGRVAGDRIEGTASVLFKPNENPLQLAWSARRVTHSAFFAPTGLDIK